MKFEATLMATALLASSVSTLLSLQMVLAGIQAEFCPTVIAKRFCADIQYERGYLRRNKKLIPPDKTRIVSFRLPGELC